MLMPTERPLTRNTHVKYQALALTVQIKLQGQGHRVKNVSTHIKVLSQGVPCGIKALALMVEK